MKYTSEFEQAHRKILVNTFRYLTNLLEKYNLRYYAIAGTALGAVRHNGIIPWDDDIDICMPRTDYKKLLDLREEMLPDGYDIVQPENDGYYLYYAKVVNMNTTLLETTVYPFLLGVFVDIFPLDYYDSKNGDLAALKKESNKLYDGFQRANANISIADVIKNRGGIRSWLYPKPFKKLLVTKFHNFEKQHQAKNGDCCIVVYHRSQRIYKKEWMDDVIELPFEGSTIKVPRSYDEMLKDEYGDYMTLPPIEKRVSEHSVVYYNLSKRLTLKEVKERIRKGKTLEL